MPLHVSNSQNCITPWWTWPTTEAHVCEAQRLLSAILPKQWACDCKWLHSYSKAGLKLTEANRQGLICCYEIHTGIIIYHSRYVHHIYTSSELPRVKVNYLHWT